MRRLRLHSWPPSCCWYCCWVLLLDAASAESGRVFCVVTQVKTFTPFFVRYLNITSFCHSLFPLGCDTHVVVSKSYQVKTLSFLTYLLRGFTPLMQPYEKQISSSVVNLLKNCPADAVATRKELLVATRHILATEFRKGFFSEVCILYKMDIVCACDKSSMLHSRASPWFLIPIQRENGTPTVAAVS